MNRQALVSRIMLLVSEAEQDGIFADDGVAAEIKKLNDRNNELAHRVRELETEVRRAGQGCRGCGTLRPGALTHVAGDKPWGLCDICLLAVKHTIDHRRGEAKQEREQQWRDRPSKPSFVYIARSLLGSDLIKIGISTDVPGRMKALQAEAVVVFPGGRREETDLHSRFASSREYGEWFAPTPELLGLIEELQADAA